MSNRPYNVYYNNLTGRVVIQKNDRYISPPKKNRCNDTFQKKMDELSKSINSTDNINIYKNNNILNLKSYSSESTENNQNENIIGKPIHSNPIHSNPIHSNPIHSNPIHSNPIHSNPIHSNPIHSNPIHSNPIHSNPIHSNPIHSNPIHSNPIHSNPMQNKYSDDVLNKPMQNKYSDDVLNKPMQNKYSDDVINKPMQNKFKKINSNYYIDSEHILYEDIPNKALQNNSISIDREHIFNEPLQNNSISIDKEHIFNEPLQNNSISIDKEHILNEPLQNNSIDSNEKKNLIYGIKKTILSDFNYLYQSSNSNDFKITINKNYNKNIFIYDSFYLFPNISEINTKTETNIINEKKIEMFNNKNDIHDIQYFPIDFVPCGVNIPLKSPNKYFHKIIIKNIFWNIFQTIPSNNYESDELLCIVPNKNDFIYKKINIQINFELHSQISKNISKKYNDKILPYKNDKIKYSTPANSCLYKVLDIHINKLNGSYFEDLEIELFKELCIDCALLCLRISIPSESMDILKGYDKNNNLLCGNIPFSQFIINFDYELI